MHFSAQSAACVHYALSLFASMQANRNLKGRSGRGLRLALEVRVVVLVQRHGVQLRLHPVRF